MRSDFDLMTASMARWRYRPRFKIPILIPIPRLFIVSLLVLSSVPRIYSSEDIIILGSIQFFKTHEWLTSTPTIYFSCQGENMTILPDVKEKDVVYTFKGEESWQPLTELPEKKCKRCGFYEVDKVKSDDVFDEWELCRDEFVGGNYVHFKEKEFNATFVCPSCSLPGIIKKERNVIFAVFIALLTMLLVGAAIAGIHKYWKKRKRQKDQARFLKLFEDNDEDELTDF